MKKWASYGELFSEPTEMKFSFIPWVAFLSSGKIILLMLYYWSLHVKHMQILTFGNYHMKI